MSDLRDFTGKNRRFTGTQSIDLPTGTTGQRDTGHGSGALRFNSTTGLMEYYTGTDWKAVDSPPAITGFTVNDVGGSAVTTANVGNATGVITFEILGSLFDSTGGQVVFESDAGGASVSTQSITRNSTNKFTVTVDSSDFTEANDPYTIKVTNGSGLAATLVGAVDANVGPSFSSAADTVFSISNGGRGSVSITGTGATDPEGAAMTFSLASGTLPSGLSLNTSTGAITGSTSAVGSNTDTNITLQVIDSASNTVQRAFVIRQLAPAITTYTSTGGFTYSVPSGVSAVQVLVVAGGGSGGTQVGGGGGAGGMVVAPAYPVTPGGTVSGTVGGGAGRAPFPSTKGTDGSNSTFGTITANGGGGGGRHTGPGSGKPGGSGGGGGDTSPGGSATQGSFTPVGATGYGNNGGNGTSGGPGWNGGGGGGAGGAGSNHQGSSGGPGGVGRQDSTSGSATYYAGGGGGCTENGTGGSGGSGGGGASQPAASQGQSASANTGGGGGGSRDAGSGSGAGGSGIVIIST